MCLPAASNCVCVKCELSNRGAIGESKSISTIAKRRTLAHRCAVKQTANKKRHRKCFVRLSHGIYFVHMQVEQLFPHIWWHWPVCAIRCQHHTPFAHVARKRNMREMGKWQMWPTSNVWHREPMTSQDTRLAVDLAVSSCSRKIAIYTLRHWDKYPCIKEIIDDPRLHISLFVATDRQLRQQQMRERRCGALKVWNANIDSTQTERNTGKKKSIRHWDFRHKMISW